MTTNVEMQRLAGENIATQTVLAALCSGLAQISPMHRRIVSHALDYAEHVVDVGSFESGAQATSVHLASFANVVEQLRTVSLGEEQRSEG